jgi:Tol biopolymer transport system component
MSGLFRPRRSRGDTAGARPSSAARASGSRGAGSRSAGAPNPLGLLPGFIAPALSAVGLVIVGAVSLGLLNGQLPTFGGGNGNNNPNSTTGPNRTATPSDVVVTDPRADVKGSILYVKDGNVWVQAGDKATQLTNSGQDSQPTWSPDGSAIYFIREKPTPGRFITGAGLKQFDLQVPSLMKMAADGSNATAILTGRYSVGSYLWSYFIQQPSISPDGRTAAIITDGPNPKQSDIVLKFLNLASGQITNPRLPELGGLGHQDPAYSPDGKSIVYTKNAREGATGIPTIVKYTIATKSFRTMTGPGYIEPAWSPDGRFLAVTKTGSTGTDIVVIDAKTGAEVLRLTNDQGSFAPEWSPAGDSIAFLRQVRGVIDLWVVKLVGSGPQWQVGDSFALTISAGLDGASRESWFIPADQLPKPTPTPVPTIGPSVVPSGAPASPKPS